MNLIKTIAYENLAKSNHLFEDKYLEKFKSTLESGNYILGKEVKYFEKRFAAYCGAKYCAGVANGLDAITLGLRALELPVNSEILVPSNTYIATITGIINAGHKPVLVEPDLNTYNIDPDQVKRNISKKTRAILVVHLYGQMAQMDKISSIANTYNLEIIEDCAQAHGATFNGKMAGTFGRIGAYSFYPTKNLGALGDAGAVITSDENIIEKIKALRNYGSGLKYYNKYIGINSRLDELQAAFLNVKLPYLDKIIKHKRILAKLYNTILTDKVIRPIENKNGSHVYHIYNIRTERRDELRTYLSQHGILTEIHYPVPPHKQEAYKKYFNKSFPISEEIHRTTLSLPISFSSTSKEVKIIVKTINNFFD